MDIFFIRKGEKRSIYSSIITIIGIILIIIFKVGGGSMGRMTICRRIRFRTGINFTVEGVVSDIFREDLLMRYDDMFWIW